MDIEGGEFECLYEAPDDCLKRIVRLRMEYHNQPDRAGHTLSDLVGFLHGKGLVTERLDGYHTGNSGLVWFVNSSHESGRAPGTHPGGW